MSVQISPRAKLVTGAILAALALPAQAHAARTAVYGGSTSAGEPIVVRADSKAKKLRGIVLSYIAPCSDDQMFPYAGELRAGTVSPGFGADDQLRMSRNKRGRFAGSNVTVFGSGSLSAATTLKVSGRLRKGSAKGKLVAVVVISDGGAPVATCTEEASWSATRARGRVYGGKTSQDEPVVVRADAGHTNVADVLIGWQSESCTPDGFFRIGDRLSDFAVISGHFGEQFTQDFDDDGGKLTYSYDITGDFAGRSVSGRLHAGLVGTDAAGAQQFSCDSGAITWSAATG
jgi:hypothetical protein